VNLAHDAILTNAPNTDGILEAPDPDMDGIQIEAVVADPDLDGIQIEAVVVQQDYNRHLDTFHQKRSCHHRCPERRVRIRLQNIFHQ
jgi:hypothetical protein